MFIYNILLNSTYHLLINEFFFTLAIYMELTSLYVIILKYAIGYLFKSPINALRWYTFIFYSNSYFWNNI